MTYMSKFVYFDLETTGLPEKKVEIVSIAAVSQGQGGNFEAFIVPKGSIHPRATEVNGFEKSGTRLLHKGSPKTSAVEPRTGLERFIRYLEKVKAANNGNALVLIAHNCFGFDLVVLCNQLAFYGIEVPQGLVGGFSDSYILAQKKFTFEPALENHKLDTIMRRLLERGQGDVHDTRPRI